MFFSIAYRKVRRVSGTKPAAFEAKTNTGKLPPGRSRCYGYGRIRCTEVEIMNDSYGSGVGDLRRNDRLLELSI